MHETKSTGKWHLRTSWKKQINEKGGPSACCCSLFQGKGIRTLGRQRRHCPSSSRTLPGCRDKKMSPIASPLKFSWMLYPSHFKIIVLNFRYSGVFFHQCIWCHLPGFLETFRFACFPLLGSLKTEDEALPRVSLPKTP